MKRLTGETTGPVSPGQRVGMNVAPEARQALSDLLYAPGMRGVGYSEFLLRAVERAQEELDQPAVHRITVEVAGSVLEAVNGRYSYERTPEDKWRLTEMGGQPFAGDVTLEPHELAWHLDNYIRGER